MPKSNSSSAENSGAMDNVTKMSSVAVLRMGKKLGLVKEKEEKLETKEFAACYAAFLVRNIEERVERLQKLRDALQVAFENNLLKGSIFRQTNDAQKNAFLDVSVNAISKVEPEMNIRILRGNLEDFMEYLIEDKPEGLIVLFVSRLFRG